MNELLQKILSQFKGIFGKLDKKQKLIAGAVVGILIGVLLITVSNSSQQSMEPLFKRALSPADYAKITKKLQEYGTSFKTKEDRFIYVKDDKLGKILRMRLGQDSLLPSGIKGWELFDTEKWTTTDFERNIMKRRAIIGAMTRHLELLDDVEKAKITVSMPRTTLYMDSTKPWKASVTLIQKPFSNLYKSKKKIKGIINLVANGIDKLLAKNIVITDNKGNILSDFSEEGKSDYLKRAKAETKIQREMRMTLEQDIRSRLKPKLGDDRFDLMVRVELDFSQKEEKQKLILPTVITKDNPNTPYDERKVVNSIAISSQKKDETFKGPTYIPEGPAGTANHIPPGLKEKINRFSHYTKKVNTVNNVVSKKTVTVKHKPFSIKAITVSAWIDGVWEKQYKDGDLVITKKGSIKRNYTPVGKDTLDKIKAILSTAIAYTRTRGDQVVVKHLQFDRRKEFELEDEEIRAKERIRKTLIAAVAALFVLFVGTLIYRAISKEIARRKRIAEEELALQQQRMREQALRSAEEEGVEVELSLEEKARMEMQENAINLARERPEDVAQVLRTWMVEE